MERYCKVVLDANFIMMPFQFGIDIKSELDRILNFGYEIYTLDRVLTELEAISAGKGRDGRAAKAAHELAKDLPKIDSEGGADETLLKIASKNTIICTNDKILREKIKRKGAPVIYLRQKKYLVID